MAGIKILLNTTNVMKSIQDLSQHLENKLVQKMHQIGRSLNADANVLANRRLHDMREEYIKNLIYDEYPIGFKLALKNLMNPIEAGFNAFPMLPRLAMGPKSKDSGKGYRWARIPITKLETKAGKGKAETKVNPADLAKAVIELEKLPRVKVRREVPIRTATTIQDKNKLFKHPGFSGVHIFDDLTQQIKKKVDQMLKEIK